MISSLSGSCILLILCACRQSNVHEICTLYFYCRKGFSFPQIITLVYKKNTSSVLVILILLSTVNYWICACVWFITSITQLISILCDN